MLEFFKLSKLSFTFSQVGWTNSLQLAVKWLVNSLSPVHFAKLQLNKRKTSANMLSLGLITKVFFLKEKDAETLFTSCSITGMSLAGL